VLEPTGNGVAVAGRGGPLLSGEVVFAARRLRYISSYQGISPGCWKWIRDACRTRPV